MDLVYHLLLNNEHQHSYQSLAIFTIIMSVKKYCRVDILLKRTNTKVSYKTTETICFYWSSRRPYPSVFMLSQGSATGILHVFLSCVVNICHYKIENFRHELHRTTGQSARAGVLYVFLCYLIQTYGCYQSSGLQKTESLKFNTAESGAKTYVILELLPVKCF